MLLIAISLVSCILSIASGIGIDGWVALSGSDPSLTAVDISAKGDQVWILGNDGAIHYWSVSALTPDGDWQYIDESNGVRQTQYPIAHIGATLDGCVWTADQKGNISVYNSSISSWTSIPGPNVTWIAGRYCNESNVVTNDSSSHYGNGNTIFYYQNKTWTQQYSPDSTTGGSYPSAGLVVGIVQSNQRYLTDSSSQIWSWNSPTTETQMPGAGKQIDAESPTRIILVDPTNKMYLWNGGGWTQIPGTAGARATINRSQAFYIDGTGVVYSANITP